MKTKKPSKNTGNRFLVSAGVALALTTAAGAQQALWGGPEIISPEIHDNHAVTFRLQAPDAEKVELSGDWM